MDENRLNSQPLPDDQPSLGWQMVEKGSDGPNLSKALKIILIGFAAVAVVGGAFIMQRDALTGTDEDEEAAEEVEEVEELSDTEVFVAWLEDLDAGDASGDAELFIETLAAFESASEDDFTTSVSADPDERVEFCFGTDTDTFCGEVTAPQWDGSTLDSFRFQGERLPSVLLRPTETVIPDLAEATYHGLIVDREWHVVADVNVEPRWEAIQETLSFGLFVMETADGTVEAEQSPFIDSELTGPWHVASGSQQWAAWKFDSRAEARNFVFTIGGQQYEARLDMAEGDMETTTLDVPVPSFGIVEDPEDDESEEVDEPLPDEPADPASEVFERCEPYANAALHTIELAVEYDTFDYFEIEEQMFENDDLEAVDMMYDNIFLLMDMVELDICSRNEFVSTGVTVMEQGYDTGDEFMNETMMDPREWADYYDEFRDGVLYGAG